MDHKAFVKTSKFLSLILRHDPERVGLRLDTAGWADVRDLVRALNHHGVSISFEDPGHIVATSDKKRLALSEDGLRTRANHGHSIEVDLQYEATVPPDLLYHGTATRFLESIRHDGLHKMRRLQVHLVADRKTALQVGGRHGKPVLLTIRAGEMHRAGCVFCCSSNGVWLIDRVPPQFINFPVTTGDSVLTDADM
jgi:putative RNA 2'-phosphotransferase